MNIYIYSKQQGAHGVSVIIDNFTKALARYSIKFQVIDSLKFNFSNDDIVISYGIKEAIEVINAGISPKISILADAISYGSLNKIKFYLKHLNIFHYDFFYCFYEYFKYSRLEKIACEKYDKLVLVSQYDIEYLKTLSGASENKFVCAPNGVDLEEFIKPKSHSNILRLGLLASWGAKQTYAESAWFVKEYFVKYHRTHPDVILKLIGRGPYIEKLRGINGVEILGSVESLNDAFSNFDIFIGANPKGCGILNRCLDAMSYKTPILSLPECFSGIPNAESLFFPFTDYNSFESQLEYVRKHEIEAKSKAEEAYNYVKLHNNWIHNYDDLIRSLFIFNC